MLEAIRSQLGGVGSIGKNGANKSRYIVTSLQDLKQIIAHFDQYHLMTQKRADYILFKRAVEIMLTKGHLKSESESVPTEGGYSRNYFNQSLNELWVN